MKLENKKRRSMVVPMVCVLLLLVLYVLSAQPVVILALYGIKYEIWTYESSLKVISIVYAPLNRMFSNSDWFSRAWLWYQDFWMPLYPEEWLELMT